MHAMLLAALLAAAPQHDTVFMDDGGRVVGTVTEDGPQGVTVQLLDGTVRTYPAREVLRIEYSDGTVSSPRSRAGAPSPAQPPSAPPGSQAPGEQPGQPPGQQTPAQPPPRQPPTATPQQEAPPTPPPRQYPPPYPPPRYPPPRYTPYPPPSSRTEQRGRMAPISPVYAVLGLGGLGISGEVEEGVAADRVFDPQLGVWLEGGVRVTPELSFAGYLGRGYGDAAAEWRTYCASYATTCSAITSRAGFLARWTFDPYGRSAPWVAVGTGWESGSVTWRSNMGGFTYGSSDLFTYSGWEALRLMAGVDLRSSPVVGVGLYGAVSWGRYTRFENANGPVDLGRQPFHTTVEAGLRFTLFP